MLNPASASDLVTRDLEQQHGSWSSPAAVPPPNQILVVLSLEGLFATTEYPMISHVAARMDLPCSSLPVPLPIGLIHYPVHHKHIKQKKM
jgi:hypothetical protein